MIEDRHSYPRLEDFAPRIVFRDRHGAEISFVDQTTYPALSRRYTVPEIGEQVQIVYSPKLRQAATMANIARLTGDVVRLFLVGLILLCTGIATILIRFDLI